MKVTVRITKTFKTAVKPLLKKYPSLPKDLQSLEKILIENPKTGTPLGFDSYKIRLKINSKGRGKSGGARVISLVESTVIALEHKTKDAQTIVSLITIYDKSEVPNISDKELKDLIRNNKSG